MAWHPFSAGVSYGGWALDRDISWASVPVRVSIDGHVKQRFKTNRRVASVNRALHVMGYHSFGGYIAVPAGRHSVCVGLGNIGPLNYGTKLGCRTITGAAVNKGAQILTQARGYVGRVAYASGGTNPSGGFDCSGLTSYTYASHGVPIPRVAQSQYNVAKPLARTSARPGDLVFFHGGGGVYHVGIYAGGNMMVAAATYGEGIKYQAIYSSAVTFGTFLH